MDDNTLDEKVNMLAFWAILADNWAAWDVSSHARSTDAICLYSSIVLRIALSFLDARLCHNGCLWSLKQSLEMSHFVDLFATTIVA